MDNRQEILHRTRLENARAREILKEFVRVYEGTALKEAFKAATEPDQGLFQTWIRAREELARTPAFADMVAPPRPRPAWRRVLRL